MLSPHNHELFARLVATPSISSSDPRHDQSNVAVAHLLANRFEETGFFVRTHPLPGGADKVNLIAHAGPEPVETNGGLVLSGHLDTVPCDENVWNFPPFSLTEKDGRLYGLGTCDMKGFFPIVLDALTDLDLRQLRRPLFLVGTADEESGMDGARALCHDFGLPGRYALIGEPTSLVPVYAHKGVLHERIRLVGRAAHASDPERGVNALDGMHAVMAELFRWRDELAHGPRHDDFAVPTATINLGAIHGGDSPNRVCGECALSVDMRLLPGMTPEWAREQMRTQAEQAVAGSDLSLTMEPLAVSQAAMHTPPESPIVRLAADISGHAPGTAGFATEGGLYNAAGLDTVILGAGDIANAHAPDEYLPLEDIKPMQRIITGLVQQLCMQDGSAAG